MNPRQRAILDISLVAILWGIPPLFIRYFTAYLDAHSQNFLRYLTAWLFLLIYGLLSGQEILPRRRAGYLRLFVAAVAVVIYQTFFTLSLYRAMPTVVSLLVQLELIVAIALSCAFFRDERRVALSPWFICGAIGALAGAVGVVVFSEQFAEAGAQPEAWENLAGGALLVVGAAVFWGAYSVAVKWSAQAISPFRLFFFVATMAAIMFFALGVAVGDLAAIGKLPLSVGLLVCMTGVACIGIAHVLYARSIVWLGVSVCNTVILASPIVVMAISPLVFGERLTGLQILCAMLLLVGAA
ncbi:DMT family transporter, partial [Candidatus Sumerlaeota bacterium]|nr:DMT family transporter [Candidatus Sumerlaeota bacterium]